MPREEDFAPTPEAGASGYPLATRREWIGLAVLALPCILYSMDLTVLNLAIPHLTADLNPSASQLLWIVDIYGFLLAGSLITMGTLGDRIGRRKLLLVGAAAFGAASVLAAFSTSAEMLIGARALLGIAAATLAPSTLSLIRNMFHDPRERTFAIGVWIASFSAGGAIGPVLGGLLLAHFWWGSVFLLNVPMMLLLLAVGPRLLPEFRDPNAGRLDLLSAALSIVAVLSVIWGIKRLAEFGPGWLPLAGIVAGLAVGAIFLRRQRTLSDPLIEVGLLRKPAFAAALGINILTIFIVFGSFLFMAQYLQLVAGMGPLEAGLWTAPSGVVFAVGSMLTPVLSRRFRPSTIIAAGLLIAAVGFAVLAQIEANDGLAILMTGMLIFCLGLAPVGTLTTDQVVSLAPPERAGAAAAISETSFEFGGALGIAVLGSIVTAVYKSIMADAVPAELLAIEGVSDTLSGAVAAAGQLSGQAGADLLAVARQAFTTAFALTALISAVIAIMAALLAVKLLRPADPDFDQGLPTQTEPAASEHPA
jgi:DHA2 family multidrug resistance protein-like MFS transporter